MDKTPQQLLIDGVDHLQPQRMKEALAAGADPFLVDAATGQSPLQRWHAQVAEGKTSTLLEEMGQLLLANPPRLGRGEVTQLTPLMQEEMKTLAFTLGVWDQAQVMGSSSPEYGRVGRSVDSVQRTFAVLRDAWVQREGREPAFNAMDFAVAFARGVAEAREVLHALRPRLGKIPRDQLLFDPTESRNVVEGIRGIGSDWEAGITVLASGALARLNYAGSLTPGSPVFAAANTAAGVITPTEDHVVMRNIGLNAQALSASDTPLVNVQEGAALDALRGLRQQRSGAALEEHFSARPSASPKSNL